MMYGDAWKYGIYLNVLNSTFDYAFLKSRNISQVSIRVSKNGKPLDISMKGFLGEKIIYLILILVNYNYEMSKKGSRSPDIKLRFLRYVN